VAASPEGEGFKGPSTKTSHKAAPKILWSITLTQGKAPGVRNCDCEPSQSGFAVAKR